MVGLCCDEVRYVLGKPTRTSDSDLDHLVDLMRATRKEATAIELYHFLGIHAKKST